MSGWTNALVGACAFLTRVPLRAAMSQAPLALSARAFPLVGLLVGAFAAIVFALADALGLPALSTAFLAVLASLLLTGALHEDGLADTADGLGGGRDREHALAIMRDSRSGAYGVLALVFSVGLRVAALAAMPTIGDGIRALVAAHAASRGFLPWLMQSLAAARTDGLGAGAGTPDAVGVLWAAGIGASIAIIALGIGAGTVALLAAASLVALLARVAQRRLGGYTGDVLGAAQQLAEIAILLTAAAR